MSKILTLIFAFYHIQASRKASMAPKHQSRATDLKRRSRERGYGKARCCFLCYTLLISIFISLCHRYCSTTDLLGASVNGAWPPHTDRLLGNHGIGREAGDTVSLVVVFMLNITNIYFILSSLPPLLFHCRPVRRFRKWRMAPHTNCVLGNYGMGRESGDTVSFIVVFDVKRY